VADLTRSVSAEPCQCHDVDGAGRDLRCSRPSSSCTNCCSSMAMLLQYAKCKRPAGGDAMQNAEILAVGKERARLAGRHFFSPDSAWQKTGSGPARCGLAAHPGKRYPEHRTVVPIWLVGLGLLSLVGAMDAVLRPCHGSDWLLAPWAGGLKPGHVLRSAASARALHHSHVTGCRPKTIHSMRAAGLAPAAPWERRGARKTSSLGINAVAAGPWLAGVRTLRPVDRGETSEPWQRSPGGCRGGAR